MRCCSFLQPYEEETCFSPKVIFLFFNTNVEVETQRAEVLVLQLQSLGVVEPELEPAQWAREPRLALRCVGIQVTALCEFGVASQSQFALKIKTGLAVFGLSQTTPPIAISFD